MYGILRKTLADGIKGELSGNSYAKSLLYILQKGGFPTKERLANLRHYKKQDLEDETDSVRHQDFRFMSVDIKGIRKFPADKNWFTVDFCKEGNPVSAVFLGSNGVGKSSVYSSLELVAKGHSHLADERGYAESSEAAKPIQESSNQETNVASELVISENKHFKYLRNTETTKANDSVIVLHTVSGDFEANLEKGQEKPLVTNAFFCSEYDIQELSRNGFDSVYICSQLGLERYHHVLKLMKELRDGYTEGKIIYQNLKAEIKRKARMIQIWLLLSSLKDTEIKNIRKNIEDKLIETGVRDLNALSEFLKNLDEIVSHNLTNFISDEEFTLFDDLEKLKKIVDLCERLSAAPSEKKQEEALRIVDESWAIASDILSIWTDAITSILDRQNEEYQQERRYNFIEQLAQEVTENEQNSEKKRAALKETPLLDYDKDEFEEFSETLNYLEKSYHKLLESHITVINNILPKILQPFYNEDLTDVKAQLSKDGMTIELSVLTKNPVIPASLVTYRNPSDPRLFLNTFRFKLFCFAFKFALMCCVKQIRDLNFPFIVDDVFDSSDFENRSEIGRVISNICRAHDDEKRMDDKPLQLIFFTQDNIIGDNIALKAFWRDEVKFSRLFDYYLAEDGLNLRESADGKTHLVIEDLL